jgi:predicted branched-subunit amino acid permease
LTVLAAGGGPFAAIAAGMLMNGRWLPMGLAVGPFLSGGLGAAALAILARAPMPAVG